MADSTPLLHRVCSPVVEDVSAVVFAWVNGTGGWLPSVSKDTTNIWHPHFLTPSNHRKLSSINLEGHDYNPRTVQNVQERAGLDPEGLLD